MIIENKLFQRDSLSSMSRELLPISRFVASFKTRRDSDPRTGIEMENGEHFSQSSH